MTKTVYCHCLRASPFAVLLLLLVFFCGSKSIKAQEPDEDDQFGWVQGLIGTYRDQTGRSCTRVDSSVALSLNREPPDTRLASADFEAHWRGRLLSEAAGQYSIFVYAQGEVQVLLNGNEILKVRSEVPAWHESATVALAFDWHPFEVRFRSTGPQSQLSLFWTGPGFGLEPLGPHRLYHESSDSPSTLYERGKLLVRALRCAACHPVGAVGAPVAAPAFDDLGGNIRRSWLIEWLTDHQRSPHDTTTRRMPSFGFSAAQATAVADYLLANSRSTTSAQPDDAGQDQSNQANEGRRLFLTLGCLACHRLGELGTSGLFSGGDLESIGAKRPPHFFEEWLRNPKKLNPNHRMPVFDLSSKEISNLAAFLSSLDDNDKQATKARFDVGSKSRQIGEQLYRKCRCESCHESRKNRNIVSRIPVTSTSSWSGGCLDAPDSNQVHPGYRLTPSDKRAIREFFNAAAPTRTGKLPDVPEGATVLAENNCFACHARDGHAGLASVADDVVRLNPHLASVRPALTPPSLNSVGDKLCDEVLAKSVKGSNPSVRPWLKVRMPRFRLTESEHKALINFFTTRDRIPEQQEQPSTTDDEGSLDLAGARLVTSEGFGCVSCHAIGTAKPPKAPLNTLGPDLAMLGGRVRLPWFNRWVRNPARIVPRMEMPSIQVPVRGVLDERIDRQLRAVWHVLSQPDFKPLPPGAVRVVRRSGDVETDEERAAILTDVFRHGTRTFIKPLVVGLTNRHNMMFDVAQNRLAAWWVGDAARQRTEGKTWFWEPGGSMLLANTRDTSELQLVYRDQVLEPLRRGQFPTEIDAWRHRQPGVEFDQRLNFEHSNSGTAQIKVRQSITPVVDTSDGVSGIRRTISISRVPTEHGVRLHVARSNHANHSSVVSEGRALRLPGKSHAIIKLVQPSTARLDEQGDVTILPEGTDGKVGIVIDYLSNIRIDRFPMRQPDLQTTSAVELSIVPGFQGTRLPLTNAIMPCALAWTPKGELIVASLKGRVWLARDTDEDQLEDQLVPYSDDLAAPYGVASSESGIDVINKYALLRLKDHDGDGLCDETVTLVSGWGHTDDYHDWVVGLPRDEQGAYFVAIPCQQDERSTVAAYLRGTLLRLEPRHPTSDNPHRFSIRKVSGGHRFPMGLARNRVGDLFVTDNQGNYNPFNELNHVVSGARYGFINSLERAPGFSPPLAPPAIDIPHPWTRSVNGICFLETPASATHELFGPFEGHLIGCEYDTRRLIRMSLQKVGNTYQGAAYPFSRIPKPREDTFLGPICCAISPSGELYVGCIRDSGWGGANNVGSIVKLQPQLDRLPLGIAEVRATHVGFTIEFTRPVDPIRAHNQNNYSISSYTRDSTPAYGGEDRDRRVDQVSQVHVSPDARRVEVRIDELRRDFVYEIRVKNLSSDDAPFFPAEAYYTLREIPAGEHATTD